ncbi:MAG: flavin reductase family protein [Candidatus Omnitrophota bacterium]
MEVKPADYRKIIPPPPVVLVSTLHGNVKNLAPYGMNMPVSFDPPLYAIGVGRTKDTYKNIIETEEFVVAVPSPELVAKINITAESFPREVSEFEKAGLTPARSKSVKPFRVKECQSNFECRLEWVKEAGDHYVVVGRVVAAWVEDRIYTENMSRIMIDPVYDISAKTGEYAGKGSLVT